MTDIFTMQKRIARTLKLQSEYEALLKEKKSLAESADIDAELPARYADIQKRMTEIIDIQAASAFLLATMLADCIGIEETP